jgi:hypothetical protein
LTKNLALFAQATSGVEEHFLQMIGALPRLKSPIAALGQISCAGASHQQPLPGNAMPGQQWPGFSFLDQRANSAI